MADGIELVPGTLEMLVLQVLADGPKHGYAIARSIAERSEDALRVEEGSLYPALHRLARDGFVSARWGVSEANRKAKFYRITASGRRRLKSRTAAWDLATRAIARVLRTQAGEAGA